MPYPSVSIGVHWRLAGLAALIILALPLAAQETKPGYDTLETLGGTELHGTFKGVDQGNYLFESPDLGTVTIKPEKLKKLTLAGSQIVFFQHTPRSGIQQAKLHLADGAPALDRGGRIFPLEVSELWKLRREQYSSWNFGGKFGFSLLRTSGSSRELVVGGITNLNLTSPHHIFGLQLEGNAGKASGKQSSQRASGRFDYKYAVSKGLALMAKQSLHHDWFKNLRTHSETVGGVSWLTDSLGGVRSSDTGISYTSKDYFRGIDNEDYWGLHLSTKSEHKAAKDLYFDTYMAYNTSLEQSAEYTFKLEAASRQSWWKGFATSLGFQLDYDNRPPSGVDHTDTRWIVRIDWVF